MTLRFLVLFVASLRAFLPVATAAQSAGKNNDAKVFRAGAATSNITPPLGISLDGPIGQNGPATHVHDEIHARCLVLDDGATRVAIVVCDSTMINRSVFDRAKAFVQAETGLPANRMLMAATHTHSTPRPIEFLPGQLEVDYHGFLARRIADGVRRAINQLAPAKIGWGSGAKPELIFNRRWYLTPGTKLPNPFGTTTDKVQMNPPSGSPNLLAPAGPVDPQIFVLSVQHADGRPLALLANYGLHYIGGTRAGAISADYFGAFADRIQELLQVDRQDPAFVGIMSNGTSGDVNGVDPKTRPAPQPPYVRIRAVADAVAQEVLRIHQGIQHRAWVPLGMNESELELQVRRPTAERLQWATSTWKQVSDASRLTRPQIYARETLALAKFPPTTRLKLQTINIGELAIAAAPCEVFAATGLEIKKQSPQKQTFTISLANGYSGYLPTPRDHELGGYETWAARSSLLEVTASEKIRDELLRLLRLPGPAGE
ncbi:MAG: hypothetical protein RIQ93_563 [Verrucomicrobiota bacterium]|jgi:hypothetical protein